MSELLDEVLGSKEQSEADLQDNSEREAIAALVNDAEFDRAI